MRRTFASTILSAGVALAAMAAAHAQSDFGEASASLMTADGQSAGSASFTGTPNGVLITVDLENLTPGEHGFHIHETGACAPDFSAAGEHFAPDGKEHGFANPAGYHAGDMPNVFVADDGTARVQVFNTRITLDDGKESVFDEDGSALVIHADPDSYMKEAGAGDRVACGVIER